MEVFSHEENLTKNKKNLTVMKAGSVAKNTNGYNYL